MKSTILLWQKQMKKAIVHPEEIVGMLIQPIFVGHPIWSWNAQHDEYISGK
jgi:hypothetical protein